MITYNVSLRIAVPIILAGVFIIVTFISVNYERLDPSFYIILVMLIAYIFLFGFAIGKRFSIPVKKILSRVSDLSKGNLKTRIYLETKDEFGELARLFNQIADELEESRSQNEATKRSVDIKVKAQTKQLEETISSLEQKVRNRTIELQKLIEEAEKQGEKTKGRNNEVAKLRREIEMLKKSLKKPSSNKNKPEISKTENMSQEE